MQKIRRALIKGSLAVPLVFTVRTASAQALGSAAACAARDAQRAADVPPEPVLVGTHDEWLRVTRELTEIRRSTSMGATVNRGPNSLGFFSSQDDSAFFELLQVGMTYTIDRHLQGNPPRPRYTIPDFVAVPPPLGTANFLVYQENGVIVGSVLDETPQGAAITGSCWCSIPSLTA